MSKGGKGDESLQLWCLGANEGQADKVSGVNTMNLGPEVMSDVI
jgi:hypothetical protein